MNFSIICLSILLVFGSQVLTISAHESDDASKLVIHVDESGFKPNKVKITSGAEVVFENAGKDVHWPASNNHPGHALYDGTNLMEHCKSERSTIFDSCGPIHPGKSWSFVFGKVGDFGFHDHLWPHLGGNVVVIDINESLAKGRNIFSDFQVFVHKVFNLISGFFTRRRENLSFNSGGIDSEFFENLKKIYVSIVYELDPRQAMRTLEEESLRDNRVSALCHDVLHVIGHTAYKKYESFKEAAKFQSDFCNSGYIHGIFESYFESTDDSVSGLAEQCYEYASIGGRQFDLWQCHHGIGHGFMYFTGGDLDESLMLCEKSLGKGAAASCQNGVFMEVFNQEVLAKENSYIDPQNPFLTCLVRNVAKGDCYLYVPTYLSQTMGMDFSDIFEECNKAEVGYKNVCLQGIGSEAIKRNMKDPVGVFALCRYAGSFVNQEMCVAGVVGMYMNQKGSYSSGKKLCEAVPQNYQNICNRTVDIPNIFRFAGKPRRVYIQKPSFAVANSSLLTIAGKIFLNEKFFCLGALERNRTSINCSEDSHSIR